PSAIPHGRLTARQVSLPRRNGRCGSAASEARTGPASPPRSVCAQGVVISSCRRQARERRWIMYSLLTMLWLTLTERATGHAPPRRRPAFRRSRQRPLRHRLELEHLEGRNLPSTLTHGGLMLGPLVQVTAGIPGYSVSDEVEPYLAVNPTNPKNMVGTWTQD